MPGRSFTTYQGTGRSVPIYHGRGYICEKYISMHNTVQSYDCFEEQSHYKKINIIDYLKLIHAVLVT